MSAITTVNQLEKAAFELGAWIRQAPMQVGEYRIFQANGQFVVTLHGMQEISVPMHGTDPLNSEMKVVGDLYSTGEITLADMHTAMENAKAEYFMTNPIKEGSRMQVKPYPYCKLEVQAKRISENWDRVMGVVNREKKVKAEAERREHNNAQAAKLVDLYPA